MVIFIIFTFKTHVWTSPNSLAKRDHFLRLYAGRRRAVLAAGDGVQEIWRTSAPLTWTLLGWVRSTGHHISVALEEHRVEVGVGNGFAQVIVWLFSSCHRSRITFGNATTWNALLTILNPALSLTLENMKVPKLCQLVVYAGKELNCDLLRVCHWPSLQLHFAISNIVIDVWTIMEP